jgi:hypothetical protein
MQVSTAIEATILGQRQLAARVGPTALVLLSTAVALLSGCAVATDDEIGGDRGGITKTIGNRSGATTFDRPAVGLIEIETATSFGVCTGTLVGKHTVLTAAHCLDGAPAQRTFFADFGPGNYVKSKVVRGVSAPGYTPVPSPFSVAIALSRSDVAILTLEQDLPGVAPIPIATQPSNVGFFATLTGYGKTSRTANDAGDGKRQTKNFIRGLTPLYLTFNAAADVFGLSCNGDSGGPALRARDGGESILGVTSFGDCVSNSNYARTDVLTKWIRDTSGGDALFVDL